MKIGESRYEGILSLDHTTIQVEAAGYSTSSRTVTAERTYPNLSDADVSLIPKTVNENGRTLTLADVSWEEAATDPTDGYDIPIRYTAMASYSGTATSKYATGYPKFSRGAGSGIAESDTVDQPHPCGR